MCCLREFVLVVAAGLALLTSGIASAKASDNWENLAGLNNLSVEILGTDTDGAKWAGLKRESAERYLRYVLQANHMTLTDDVHKSAGEIQLSIYITASKENGLCLFHVELRVISAAKIIATKQMDPKAIIWETGRTGLSGRNNAAAGITQSIIFLAKDLALQWSKANPRP